MEGKFVSDISNVIMTHYNKKEFEDIYNVFDVSISDLETSMNYDSAYRLQQDIAVLNTSLLNDISEYINKKPIKQNKKHKSNQKDTFKEQNESMKVNLVYKYFYLILKIIIIFALMTLFYMKVISSGSASNAPSFTSKLGVAS
jgi:ATP-dependent Zn protease